MLHVRCVKPCFGLRGYWENIWLSSSEILSMETILRNKFFHQPACAAPLLYVHVLVSFSLAFLVLLEEEYFMGNLAAANRQYQSKLTSKFSSWSLSVARVRRTRGRTLLIESNLEIAKLEKLFIKNVLYKLSLNFYHVSIFLKQRNFHNCSLSFLFYTISIAFRFSADCRCAVDWKITSFSDLSFFSLFACFSPGFLGSLGLRTRETSENRGGMSIGIRNVALFISLCVPFTFGLLYLSTSIRRAKKNSPTTRMKY